MAVIVVDGDILPYQIGHAMDDGADWHQVRSSIQEQFSTIMNRGAHFIGEDIDEVKVYLSDPEGTFRKKCATILPYKGNRTPYKPYHWDGIRAYLRDQYGAAHLDNLEGDDCCLIFKDELEKQGKTVLVASMDKDLKQVPIKMYRWPTGRLKEEFYHVTHPVMGYRNFWSQMLIGDKTDNILGLFGVGPTTASVKKVFTLTDPVEMARLVYDEYYRRFGSYAKQFFAETFRLLRIIDSVEYFQVCDPDVWMDLLLDVVWKQIGEENASN